MVMRHFRKVLARLGLDRRPLLGLDLGDTAVRALALQFKTGQLCLLDYAIVPLEAGAIVAGSVIKADSVIAAIKHIARQFQNITNKVCIALPDDQVISRVMQCAAGLNDREIGSEIALTADHYIPWPLHEVQFDYKIIGKNARDADLLDILVVATKKVMVRHLTAIMQAADLDLVIVEPQADAIARAAKQALHTTELNLALGDNINAQKFLADKLQLELCYGLALR